MWIKDPAAYPPIRPWLEFVSIVDWCTKNTTSYEDWVQLSEEEEDNWSTSLGGSTSGSHGDFNWRFDVCLNTRYMQPSRIAFLQDVTNKHFRKFGARYPN